MGQGLVLLGQERNLTIEDFEAVGRLHQVLASIVQLNRGLLPVSIPAVDALFERLLLLCQLLYPFRLFLRLHVHIVHLELDERTDVGINAYVVVHDSHGAIVLAADTRDDGKVVPQLLKGGIPPVLGDDLENLNIEVGDILHLAVGVVDAVAAQEDRHRHGSLVAIAVAELVDGVGVADGRGLVQEAAVVPGNGLVPHLVLTVEVDILMERQAFAVAQMERKPIVSCLYISHERASILLVERGLGRGQA